MQSIEAVYDAAAAQARRCCILPLDKESNVKKIVSPALLAVVLFFVLNPAAIAAGVAICGPLGEILYKKHCSACHHDAAKLKSVKNIAEIIRNPPAVMPVFGKDKISDRGAQEIADYIYQGSDFQVRSKKRR